MSMNLFTRAFQDVGRRAGRLLSSNDGPPDLDEVWRDFKRKFVGLFGGKGGDGQGGGDSQPGMKGAGIGVGLIAGVVVLAWLGSGTYTVQEGQQAVVTSFGKYSKTVDAGLSWRLPYPFQAHEIVAVTQLQQIDIGRSSVVPTTGLRDSSMLTEDENIVDILFSVQYVIKDARDYLFNNNKPDEAVMLAAESAMREIVGKGTMDSVLYEQRDAVAIELAKSVQTQLDRLKAGILIKNVNVKSVQPPEQVQDAFADAFRATSDRERLKNEAQAYANTVIPKAQGEAAKLQQEAEGYKARVVSVAEGDAQRFKSVLAEYQKAPAVTRDRLYLDTMRTVYSSVTKVMVDSRSGNNMLYLPLDKLLQQTANDSVTVSAPVQQAPAADSTAPAGNSTDPRSRDNQRGRDGR